MTTKHTPLPWALTEYTNYDGFSVQTPDFGCIAERWEEGATEARRLEMHANAAFIVRACNSHYGLLGALKIAREYVAATHGVLPTKPNLVSPDLDAIDEAIENAERNF